MKAKGMILLAIMALIGVLGVNAQEIQNNESVEYTINYTKELLQKSDNKILLPKEVNYLLGCGDSDSIYLTPEWDDAYIENGGNNILVYIVPLIGKANNVEIVAELNVVRETFSYHRMVTSHFKLSNDSTVEKISIISNIYGDLSGVEIYDNNMNLKDAISINSNGISAAIDMSRLKKNYNK